MGIHILQGLKSIDLSLNDVNHCAGRNASCTSSHGFGRDASISM